jgi:hypothetical protein
MHVENSYGIGSARLCMYVQTTCIQYPGTITRGVAFAAKPLFIRTNQTKSP